ncbi:MAG: hypothetical protein HY704_11255 [Gemmatimonadetes bacterium]|nr:hypothetical protein [Gemmatimonadota bacterium]
MTCRILLDDDPDEVHRAPERAAGLETLKITAPGRARSSPPSPLAPEILRPVEWLT